MEVTLDTLRARDRYALLTSVIVPRPIAWVTTMDPSGHVNLAPFSYFSGLGSDPAMITLAIASRRDGTDKDTLRIAQATGVLCVNLVEEHHLEAMNRSSADLAPDVSELPFAGVETTPCEAIAGVRVRGARAALECRLVDVHGYGHHGKVSLCVAEVVHAFLDDAIVEGGAPVVDPARIAPVARLGGAAYATLGRRLVVPRPTTPGTGGA